MNDAEFALSAKLMPNQLPVLKAGTATIGNGYFMAAVGDRYENLRR